jgi:hypothetical protein
MCIPIDENFHFLSNRLGHHGTSDMGPDHLKYIARRKYSWSLHQASQAFSLIFFAATGFFLAGPLYAQEPLPALSPALEKHAEGVINWTSGTISAKGLGAPPASTPSGAAHTMATRAAIAVARRNLVEIVEGVRIDSETLVENFIVKSDIIRSHVQGIVKNALVTQTINLPDGNVEVELTVNMWGNDSLLFRLIAETMQFSNAREVAGNPGNFTGFIIDARDLGIQPATFPTVKDESGHLLYEKKTAPYELVRKRGLAQYFVPTLSSFSSFPKNSTFQKSTPHFVTDQNPQPTPEARVGPRPLQIQAIQKTGSLGTDIIVSAADAKKIRQDPALMELLHNARVIIVIDPLVAGVEGHRDPGNVMPVIGPWHLH